jgi:hypothetical protein
VPRSQKKKTDHADAVIRVKLQPDDFEASIAAIKQALFEVGPAMDRVNATRKKKRKLSSNFEITFLDAAGNREFVIPASGDPEWCPDDKQIDPANFPNFAYMVAADDRGEKIVIRIEYERTTVQ